MRAVVQRVTRAKVTVADEVTGEIEKGLVVLLGVARDDTKADVEYLVSKIAALRIFEDADDKMNLSMREVNGGLNGICRIESDRRASGGGRVGTKSRHVARVKERGQMQRAVAEDHANGVVVVLDCCANALGV